MSKKRLATILAPMDLGSAGTKTIDINIKDTISRITMIWKATVATVSVMTAPVLRALSKIELVDGSDVLFSLSGEEAQALNYYDRKVMPYNSLSLTVGGFQTAEVSIDFGRYLYDPILALDPSKFSNLQLKITWDEDAANASVVTNSFQVYAYIFEDEKLEPTGFLQAKEQYQYSMAASAHEYIDLPTDYPLRQLLLRAYSEDHAPLTLLDTLKLSIDNDKRVPLDMKADDYTRAALANYPRIQERVTYDAAVTAKTIYAPVSQDIDVSISYDDTLFVTAQSKFAVATITGAKIALAASVDIKALDGHIFGYLPHNCIPIPLGDQQSIEDWLAVADIGSLRANILSSSDADSGDTGYIIMQQLRSY